MRNAIRTFQFAMLLSSLASLGCSQVSFETMKSTALKASVMDDSSGPDDDTASGQIKQPYFVDRNDPEDSLDPVPGRIRQPNDPTNPGPNPYPFEDAFGRIKQGPSSLVIKRMCSNRRSDENTNLKRAMNTPSTVIQFMINGKVCTSDRNTIYDLVTRNSRLTFDMVRKLCPSLIVDGGNTATIFINGKEQIDPQKGQLSVLYARRDTKASSQSPATELADEFCTERASPLVVHLASDPSNPSPIALSSQKNGIDFDLLGITNNFRKVRISWFTNRDYRMLVLPNHRGEVLGIDQLFGDNTQGPDGELASDGYAALAKYDGTSADGLERLHAPNGFIDKNDPIFSRLRLWLDKNRDGRSQPGELISLRAARIAFIDLKYSDEYAEVDRYGNETKMKSVVGYENGSLDLIFDLWFAYQH